MFYRGWYNGYRQAVSASYQSCRACRVPYQAVNVRVEGETILLFRVPLPFFRTEVILPHTESFLANSAEKETPPALFLESPLPSPGCFDYPLSGARMVISMDACEKKKNGGLGLRNVFPVGWATTSNFADEKSTDKRPIQVYRDVSRSDSGTVPNSRI